MTRINGRLDEIVNQDVRREKLLNQIQLNFRNSTGTMYDKTSIVLQGLRSQQLASSLANASRAEQGLMRSGLATPILRWRDDLCAQARRSVPGPARVIKHRARQRNEVGAAVGNDGLGLLGFGDQANRDHRHVDMAADVFGQAHLVARTHADALQR